MFGDFRRKARLFLMEQNLGGNPGTVDFETHVRALTELLMGVTSHEREAMREFLNKRLDDQAKS